MILDYKEQPTDKTCGQTCVSMILWISVEEVINVMGKNGVTCSKDFLKVFQHYGVHTDTRLRKIQKEKPLPSLCIVRLVSNQYAHGHWSVYHHGVFYDPTYGVLECYPEDIRCVSYFEIKKEPAVF